MPIPKHAQIQKFGKEQNLSPKIKAWFKMDFFQHILDFLSNLEKKFCNHCDEDTFLADEIIFLGAPEWYHETFSDAH